MNKKQKLLEIEHHLFGKYSFRYNQLIKELEWKSGNNDYNKVTDRDYKKMIRSCIDANIDTNHTLLELALSSTEIENYDPLKDYFRNLPQYDGVTDYIAQLAGTIKSKHQARFHAYLKIWLVSWIAGLLEEKIINHFALILQGDQGIGKTTWISKLVPQPLKRYYYSGTINPKNKDISILQANCILINLDELDNLNKKESANLKTLLTNSSITCRLTYDRRMSNFYRVASYAGSINDLQFLRDTTGSRRYLVTEAQTINFNSMVDMDLVFSQAKYLFENGFKYWVDKPEINEIQSYNERFRVITYTEEIIVNNFYKPNESEEFKLMNAGDIYEILNRPYGLSLIMIGKVMKKLGYIRVKSFGYYKYKVVFKDEGQNYNKTNKPISVDPKNGKMNLSMIEEYKNPTWINNVLEYRVLGKKVG